MNLLELERQIGTMFKSAGFDQPGFEARQLLLGALNLEMADLLNAEAQTVAPQLVRKIQDWMQQRIHGVPLAYLTGKKGFYKHDFLVTPGVLVPRPETEHVIEVALERMKKSQLKVQTLADLGCGTGCLGLSLLLEIPAGQLFALDISAIAMENTLANAKQMGVEARTHVLCQSVEDWRPPCEFELIVANPPYIAIGDPEVESGVYDHEPHQALYSGSEGLEAIRAWTTWATRHLKTDGLFVCEFGAGQSKAVHDIIRDAGLGKIQILPDLAGKDRVVSALKRGK